jgi:hypothetical protein
MLFEYSLGGKVVELLNEVAPELRRVAVVRDPANPSNLGQFGAIQAATQPPMRHAVSRLGALWQAHLDARRLMTLAV